jgi:hypothetical protein
MCLKFGEKITNPSTLVSLIDDDYGITFELYFFASNIRRKVYGVLDFIIIFKIWKKIKIITFFYARP